MIEKSNKLKALDMKGDVWWNDKWNKPLMHVHAKNMFQLSHVKFIHVNKYSDVTTNKLPSFL